MMCIDTTSFQSIKAAQMKSQTLNFSLSQSTLSLIRSFTSSLVSGKIGLLGKD